MMSVWYVQKLESLSFRYIIQVNTEKNKIKEKEKNKKRFRTDDCTKGF